MHESHQRQPLPARNERIEVDGVVLQLSMLLDGSCLVGGLIPYARYELELESEAGECIVITTADDETFVLSDPPAGILRFRIDATRCTPWIER